MERLLSAFEILSIALPLVLALLAGAWALLERSATLQRRFEEQESKHTQKAISRLEALLDKLSEKILDLEGRFNVKVADLTQKFHDIQVALIKNASEIKETRDSMGQISKSFDSKVAQVSKELSKLQEVYVGEGRYRLTGNKPKG